MIGNNTRLMSCFAKLYHLRKCQTNSEDGLPDQQQHELPPYSSHTFDPKLTRSESVHTRNSLLIVNHSRTVFGLTRSELETLKKISSFNFLFFVISLTIVTFLIVFKIVNYYPFNNDAARQIFIVLGILMTGHSINNFIGFASTQREIALAIDIYCVCNLILIVVDILFIVYFQNYSMDYIRTHFRSHIQSKFIVIIFIFGNIILTLTAFIVECQIRAYSHVDRIAIKTESSTSLLRV